MSAEDGFDRALTVQQRNPWVVAVACAPFAAAVALVIASLMAGAAWAALAPHAVILGLVMLVWAARRNPFPRMTMERVRIASEALHIGARAIPLDRVANAVLVPGPGFPRVVVERRGPNWGSIELIVRDVNEGRSILRGLGFDATQCTFRIKAASWLRSTWTRSTLTVVGGVAAIFASFPIAELLGIAPLFAFAVIGLPILTAALIPTKVEVGADGIFLQWLRWKRFLPLRSIRAATVYRERVRNQVRVGVTITLVDSEELTLPMDAVERAQALVERIDEVRADARGGSRAVDAVRTRLARPSTTTADWLRALRALGSGAIATHRVAPVAPEAFLAVIEDTSATPADRAAAAIALASSGEPAMKDRIRIATDTVAEPRLRLALERALGEDDAALEAAVDELARDDPPRRAR